ncbi:MBL fold metallo-hydrolase [Alcaligenes faecalis]|uniref:MBL fold metallo-hydrolase n=1 Tax=Alcaligenes faecalis TaxID=511 RepID=UPI001C9BAB2A|nr:MBL fold metallo-hydrolase [Alcaligenes faecalis]MBY6309903.1 MBL fold metallo-hydrolase [Alcaligenes faecalis]MBY6315973.1 MBL fold metallo-hydrolase [Alcaligenes faecalis]MBY6390820.1 MBL fold metallo-hydrolase [Alcaligenes faecalis]
MKVLAPLMVSLSLGASVPTAWSAPETVTDTTVEVQLIRNATVKIDFSGTTFLVDPMLSAKGEFPGFPGTYRSELRNPLVDLPFSAKEVLDSVEAVVVTHTHTDHWDEAAQKAIPKDLPVFTQNEADAKMIRSQGFKDVRVLDGSTTFKGVKLSKTGGQHGTDLWFADPVRSEAMGPVMGVVFSAPQTKTVYVAGDTVWRPEVDQALEQHKPDVVILNTGSALMSGFEQHPIIMGKQDTLQATKAAPNAAIVAVHMDSVNHMSLSRKELSEFVKGQKIEKSVLIPADGESMKF